ncbi:RuBisCO accumulation factor 1 [Thermocoleostomius sinensis]|uniref:RuBisCO accumulation factor 1 n=1 Tax=Thermocoleostomius sinensis A174 TaxID=2016057 RepID=A0A9E8ZLD4_9CYAN|nr:RuBisCO accumulation factor 1 [Thermocoleostomius sinensis]WAL60626.1 hypothetical protein OXH18_01115 [Thermocoleostomius sinensis A174]
MSTLPSNPSDFPSADPLTDEAAQELLLALRRKEGNWIAWGQACQRLHKAGYSPQRIFEETGFEPSQQNQITVAAQVYQSIANQVATDVLARFDRTGSDLLYEFRILSQAQRCDAAAIAVEKGIDSEGARDIAKALKEFGWLSNPPKDFTEHPSDAITYYYWKLARQQSDLQTRSRLIAQALRFASSDSARRQVEALLTDFTVSRIRSAPRLPFYRLESAEEQPRVIPVAGKLPLATADLKAVPVVDEHGAFKIVQFSGVGAWTALPSWQVVRNAEDPVMVMTDSNQLAPDASEATEEVLVMIDRAQRQWNDESYFAVDQSGQLEIRWFEEAPDLPLLGQVVLVLRPKKVLDEDFNKELWQVEE